MTLSDFQSIDNLEEDMRVLQAKLAAVEQKKLALLETEGALRTSMQRIENRIYRLKKLQTTDGETK